LEKLSFLAVVAAQTIELVHCSITQISNTCIWLKQSTCNHQRSLPDSEFDERNQRICGRAYLLEQSMQ